MRGFLQQQLFLLLVWCFFCLLESEERCLQNQRLCFILTILFPAKGNQVCRSTQREFESNILYACIFFGSCMFFSLVFAVFAVYAAVPPSAQPGADIVLFALLFFT